MGKKKKKDKLKSKVNKSFKTKAMLNDFDDMLMSTYSDLTDEILDIQRRLEAKDLATRKKAKKKLKKNPKYNINKDLRKNRIEIIESMEDNNLLDRITSFVKDMGPILITLSRMILCLILSILSITTIKTKIKPETLLKLNNIVAKLSAIG